MKRILLVLPVALLFLPKLAVAQGGLVACTGLDCGTCEFVATVQLAFRFLITIGSIVATIVLVYVGLRLATSAGSEDAKTAAKTALWNIIIGFVLIIAAYAIVNVIMRAILPEDSPIFPWDSVPCINAITPQDTRVSYGDGTATSGPLAELPPVPGVDLCNDEYLGTHFAGEERVAACVMAGESTCGASFYSTTDINHDTSGNRVPFSVSPWQINLTVHDIRPGECSSGPINCTEAYSGRNYSATLVNRSIYDQCIEAMRDPQCSGNMAERIRREQGWSAWSAHSANGCGG